MSFTLEWSPPEAAVLIDGKPLSGAGRATLRLPTGRHVLSASAPPGYAALQQPLDVTLGMSPVQIALVSTRVPVTLAWTPALAEVSVDGVPIAGRDGQAQVPLLPGTHALLVRAAGYAEHSQLVTVAPGAERQAQRLAELLDNSGVDVRLPQATAQAGSGGGSATR